MKKMFFAILLTFLCAISLYATDFYIGTEVGPAINMIRAGSGYRDYEFRTRVGYDVAIPMIVRFSKNLSLYCGFSAVEKSYGYYREYSSYSIMNLKYRNTFFEAPIGVLGFIPLKSTNIDIILSAGGFIGVWSFRKADGSFLNPNVATSGGTTITATENGNFDYCNRLEYGLSFSTGIALDYPSWLLMLRAKYSLALSDMNKSEDHQGYPMYNSTISILFSFLYKATK